MLSIILILWPLSLIFLTIFILPLFYSINSSWSYPLKTCDSSIHWPNYFFCWSDSSSSIFRIHCSLRSIPVSLMCLFLPFSCYFTLVVYRIILLDLWTAYSLPPFPFLAYYFHRFFATSGLLFAWVILRTWCYRLRWRIDLDFSAWVLNLVT